MRSIQFNWKYGIWMMIEIWLLTAIYYLFQWMLQNTAFPFIDNMILSILILLLTLGTIYILTILGCIKLEERITKSKLNVAKGLLFFTIGAMVSIVGMNLLYELNIINNEFPLLLFIIIIMSISVVGLTYGLHFKKKNVQQRQ